MKQPNPLGRVTSLMRGMSETGVDMDAMTEAVGIACAVQEARPEVMEYVLRALAAMGGAMVIHWHNKGLRENRKCTMCGGSGTVTGVDTATPPRIAESRCTVQCPVCRGGAPGAIAKGRGDEPVRVASEMWSSKAGVEVSQLVTWRRCRLCGVWTPGGPTACEDCTKER